MENNFPLYLKAGTKDFLTFTSQMIKFDLVKNHPKVLDKLYVGAKDRKYQLWERSCTRKMDVGFSAL